MASPRELQHSEPTASSSESVRRIGGDGDFLKKHLIGAAPRFVDALTLIRKSAHCDAAVLLHGETGTGKELAARAIHYLGARSQGPFVPVNCGAIPEPLLESEFFGHVRGAFTDARETRQGVVSQARGGSLFLDELETLSPRGQIVLLRFLQDQSYRPVGGDQLHHANVRIVGSTNADLHAMAAQGKFRLDLLYRLQVLALELPALRHRPGDAMLLAVHFAERLRMQYGRPPVTFAPEALRYLEQHEWPGNVRELENLIHRELLLADGPVVSLQTARACAPHTAPSDGAIQRFRAAKARVVAEFEKQYITDLLRRTRGNVSLAARLAGKDRSRLGKLVKKHGLERLTFARARVG
jgi:DNA-binding NtrC family response regulator